MPRTQRIATRRSTSEDRAIDDHVGNRIKLRRNLLGISQNGLAEACGVSFQQVQKYEMGMNRVSASRLYQLARCLSCEPTYFFEDLPGTTSEQDPMKAGRAIELVLHFNRIAERDQEAGDALLTLIRRVSGDERVRALGTG